MTALDSEVSANTHDQDSGLTATRTQGWNGAVQHTMYGMAGENATALQGAFVAKFNGTMQGCSRTLLRQYLQNVVEQAKLIGDPQIEQEAMVTLMVMSFQLRDHKGTGKGLRDLSRWLWLELYQMFPRTFLALVSIVPDYGYWKDLQQLVADLHDSETNISPPLKDRLIGTIYDCYADQIKTDNQIYLEYGALQPGQDMDSRPTLSLCVKWVPKEGRSFDRQYGMTKEIAQRIFPQEFQQNPRTALRKFRQMITPINKAINTTETFMHEGQFQFIKFRLVPGRCFQMKRRGFFNLVGGSKSRSQEERSSDEDRRKCKANALAHLEAAAQGKTKVNAKSLFPHEIVNKFAGSGAWSYQPNSLSKEEAMLYEAQFASIFKQLEEKSDSGEIDMGRMVTLLDVSGSMYSCTSSGGKHRPVDAAVAISVMVARLAKGSFRNRALAFSENPTWLQWNESMNFAQMIATAFNCPGQGLSTDFLSCHNLILDLATQCKCSPDQLPDRFLVLSDMQYNQAAKSTGRSQYSILSQYINGTQLRKITPVSRNSYSVNANWLTHHEILVRAYREQGIKVCGEPWVLPETIYWNLNGSTTGATVQADTPNTQIISGFNPRSIEIVLGGELDQLRKQDPEKKVTPWDTFQVAMNHEDWDPVRKVISDTGEGIFQGYQPPNREQEETGDDFVVVDSSK
jgi:hypothetical protein